MLGLVKIQQCCFIISNWKKNISQKARNSVYILNNGLFINLSTWELKILFILNYYWKYSSLVLLLFSIEYYYYFRTYCNALNIENARWSSDWLKMRNEVLIGYKSKINFWLQQIASCTEIFFCWAFPFIQIFSILVYSLMIL